MGNSQKPPLGVNIRGLVGSIVDPFLIKFIVTLSKSGLTNLNVAGQLGSDNAFTIVGYKIPEDFSASNGPWRRQITRELQAMIRSSMKDSGYNGFAAFIASARARSKISHELSLPFDRANSSRPSAAALS